MFPMTGPVASRLTVTLLDDVPPALVAVQVIVVVPSAAIVAVAQPLSDVIGEPVSVTAQVTTGDEVYQPFEPSVPVTLEAIVGGVESTTVTVKFLDPVFPAWSCAVHVTVVAPRANDEPEAGE